MRRLRSAHVESNKPTTPMLTRLGVNMEPTSDARFYDVVYLFGFGTLALLYIAYRLLAGTWLIPKIWNGSDQRPSTSKFQFALWTGCIFFSYVVIYVARQDCAITFPIYDIPQNILIALGLSIVTAVAAKGITVSYLSNGQIDEPTLAAAPATAATSTPSSSASRLGLSGTGGVLLDDCGVPDISKIQMIGWTFIALVIYLHTVVQRVAYIRSLFLHHLPMPPANIGLPDIDAALMVLMGLGQGAYLGKKLVTTSTPRLSGISPSVVAAGSSPVMTLLGTAMGDGVGDQVLLDGVPLSVPPSIWSDTSIQFPWPSTQASGDPYAMGQQVSVGLIVNGEACSSLPVFLQGPNMGGVVKTPGIIAYASGTDNSAKVVAGIPEKPEH